MTIKVKQNERHQKRKGTMNQDDFNKARKKRFEVEIENRKLDIYEIENDLEFNCDAMTRVSFINQLKNAKTRKEQNTIIEYLKDENIINDY